jgi:hypothetical protein
VPRPLPRFELALQRRADEQKLARILIETGEDAPPETLARATLAGDGRRLRGIPAVSRGTSGAIAGTDPLRALLAKERRRR